MKVHNNTPDPIIAFGVHEQYGYGDEVTIPPGGSVDLSGPSLGQMGGGACFVHLEGEITCQTGEDDEHGFQVLPGAPLCLCVALCKGVMIRHYQDEPESRVLILY